MSELPDTDDPYELLGVPEDADRKTLKRAYVRAIRTFRPEHHPDEFQAIRAAYDTALARLQWATMFGDASESPASDADSVESSKPVHSEPESRPRLTLVTSDDAPPVVAEPDQELEDGVIPPDALSETSSLLSALEGGELPDLLAAIADVHESPPDVSGSRPPVLEVVREPEVVSTQDHSAPNSSDLPAGEWTVVSGGESEVGHHAFDDDAFDDDAFDDDAFDDDEPTSVEQRYLEAIESGRGGAMAAYAVREALLMRTPLAALVYAVTPEQLWEVVDDPRLGWDALSAQGELAADWYHHRVTCALTRESRQWVVDELESARVLRDAMHHESLAREAVRMLCWLVWHEPERAHRLSSRYSLSSTDYYPQALEELMVIAPVVTAAWRQRAVPMAFRRLFQLIWVLTGEAANELLTDATRSLAAAPEVWILAVDRLTFEDGGEAALLSLIEAIQYEFSVSSEAPPPPGALQAVGTALSEAYAPLPSPRIWPLALGLVFLGRIVVRAGIEALLVYFALSFVALRAWYRYQRNGRRPKGAGRPRLMRILLERRTLWHHALSGVRLALPSLPVPDDLWNDLALTLAGVLGVAQRRLE